MKKYSIVNGNVRQNNTGKEYRFEKLNMLDYEGYRFTTYTRLAYYLLYGNLPNAFITLHDPALGFIRGNFKVGTDKKKVDYSNKFKLICLNLCRIYLNKPDDFILGQFERSWYEFKLRNNDCSDHDKISGHLEIAKFLQSRPKSPEVKDTILDDFIISESAKLVRLTANILRTYGGAGELRVHEKITELLCAKRAEWSCNPSYTDELFYDLFKPASDVYNFKPKHYLLGNTLENYPELKHKSMNICYLTENLTHSNPH